MRKQYHFRKTDGRLLAWDVDKLIALTSGLNPETILLGDISELDETYWYDSVDDEPTCRSIAAHIQLVKEADLAYPIIVCPNGRVMDGMHRAVKALAEGLLEIQAYRLPKLPPPDYVDADPDELPYDTQGYSAEQIG